MGGLVKGRLEVGGVPILDRILERLGQCCAEIFIVANDPDPYRSWRGPLYADVIPERGSLGGIYTALNFASTEHVFVCACDMPFISVDLIQYLRRRLDHYDAVIPRDAKGLQPMHGLYTRRIVSVLETRLRGDDLKVEHFIDSIDALILGPEEVATVEPLGTAFLNVNTPDDLRHANRWAALGG